MKLAVRIFALVIVFAGLAAAKVSMATPSTQKSPVLMSHQAATAAMPFTFCVPRYCDLW